MLPALIMHAARAARTWLLAGLHVISCDNTFSSRKNPSFQIQLTFSSQRQIDPIHARRRKAFQALNRRQNDPLRRPSQTTWAPTRTPLRRREIPHFSLHRKNSIPLFYGMSEIFLRLRKIPLWKSSCKGIFGLFFAS